MFCRTAAMLSLRRRVAPTSITMSKMTACASSASSGVVVSSSSLSSLNLLTQRRFHGNDEEHGHVLTGDRDKPITTNWIFADGSKHAITCYEGQTLLEVAQEHQLPIEGACAGSCACSTCHVYLRDEDYDKFEEPSDEENDMLDLAFFPQATSRLGCQIKVRKAVDGLEVQLPKATRNMAVDGYVAKPH